MKLKDNIPVLAIFSVLALLSALTMLNHQRIRSINEQLSAPAPPDKLSGVIAAQTALQHQLDALAEDDRSWHTHFQKDLDVCHTRLDDYQIALDVVSRMHSHGPRARAPLPLKRERPKKPPKATQ